MNRIADRRGYRGPRLQRKLLAAVIAAGFGAASALANPLGPQVVNGQVGFATQGNVLTVTNTPGAIINWQNFSIGSGEVTRFLQENAGSAVLNRITGQDPSQILGALQSNGRVFLVNPNGIVFGQGARVDVNGLVASTLDIANTDFLAGKLDFHAGALASGIRNQGTITTPEGGRVYLIAPQLENSGIINTPGGDVLLAAGHSVQLVDSTDPALQVVVSAPDDRALNLGSVVAAGGRIGIYGALVDQRGIVNADSAVVGADGHVVLKASHATTLAAGSRTSARGAGNGGEIELLGEDIALNGDARVDASGAGGGGSVLIGGDAHGANPAVQNAQQVFVGRDAAVSADATGTGNGGKLVLWSEQATRAYGTLSAHGGAGGGNGGWIETSGHSLDTTGLRVDAGAGHGLRGSWLLDPYDITVTSDSGGTALTDVDQFADLGGASAAIAPATIAAANADVMLQATNDINFNEALTMSNGNVGLTAQAGNSIYVWAPITTFGGKVTLVANTSAGGVLSIESGGGITTNGADIGLLADRMALAAPINAGAGRVTLAPVTAGTAIDLGSVTDQPPPNTLTLSNADLSQISQGSPVTIGDASSSGPISISSALTESFPELSLLSAGSITQYPGATLGGGLSLRIEGSDVALLEANPTGVIAGKASSGNFLYRSVNGIAVQAVDGTSGISVPASGRITLWSDAEVGQSAPVSGGALAVIAGGNVSLDDPSNNIARFAAILGSNAGPSAGLSLYNQGDLDVDAVLFDAFGDSLSGISGANGAVRLATGPGAHLKISQPVFAGITGSVDLEADNLALAAGVIADEVSIRPHTGGRPITVGASTCHDVDAGGGCLALSQLWQVDAPTIGIGRDSSDGIGGGTTDSLSGPIYVAGITSGGSAETDRNPLTTRIGLLSGAGVSQGGAIGIDVQDLGVIAAGSANVDLGNPNNKVVNLAGQTGGGNFAFSDAIALHVATLSSDNAPSLPDSYGSDSLQGDVLASQVVLGQTPGTGSYSIAGINAGSGAVTLKSADALSGGGIVAASLNAEAGNGIDLATQVGALRAINTDNSGSSAIAVTNTGAMSVNDVRQAGSAGGGITVSNVGALTVVGGHAVSTNSGAILLQAHSPLTVDGSVSSGSGAIELDAVSSVAGNDVLTINGNVATSGAVRLAAGTALVLNGTVSGSSVTSDVNGVVTTGVGSDGCSSGAALAGCNATKSTTNTVVSTMATTVRTATDVTSLVDTGSGDSATTQNGGTGTSSSGNDDKSGESKDEKKTAAGPDDNGAKNNEHAKKMYCN